MNVLITGSDGFIAKNLKFFLNDRSDIKIYSLTKKHNLSELDNLVNKVDFVFHLAGTNRSENLDDFTCGNEKLTYNLCCAIKKTKKKIPIIYSSTIKVESSNPYGVSKKNTEKILYDFSNELNNPLHIFRLPNVFGKWSKPNYNSVVSTFCYNINRDIPIKIDNSKKILSLVYIDDVIHHFIEVMDNPNKNKLYNGLNFIKPIYNITVGDLAKKIYSFREIRNTNVMERVGTGFIRALYSTYISYMSEKQFSYALTANKDSRGKFVEILKTPDCGQFSYFTVLPNSNRGGHYHHSKTEKFLIINGVACFKFVNLITSEKYEIIVNSNNPEIVETIPGWSHSITNIGKEELIAMLWSNEIFNPKKPDTYSFEL